MSKLLAALIGAGVAVGVGYVIWRVCKERDRKAKDEAAKRESDAAQGSDAEAPLRRPSVSAKAPAANEATPAAPPASAAPPARAAGSSTPTLDPMKPLADAGKPEQQTAPAPAPMPRANAAQVEPTPIPRPAPRLANPDALITRSTCDERTGHVHQRPGSLLEQARRIVPDLTLAEYTAARMLTSERFDGTPTDRLTESIAPRGAYGDQGNGGHRIATTRAPALAHVEAAGRVLGGERRGKRNGEASTKGAIP